MSRLVRLHGGKRAGLQLAILRAVSRAARPIGQKGVHRVAWRLARRFDARNAAVLQTRIGRVYVRLGDGYAVKLLDPGYRYEPELEPIVRRAMERGCYFIDGGANLGYWSVLASGACGAPGRVVAVEPVPALFEVLRHNASLNDDRFICEPAALWSEGGGEVEFLSHPEWHAGSTAVHAAQQGRAGTYSVTVPTVTVDDLVRRFCPDERTILLKLDVEGAEPHALAGAAQTFKQRETVVLYEDHGSDPDHRSTRYVLEELGYRVFACAPTGPQEIADLEEVSAFKPDRKHGFNFFGFPAGGTLGPELLGR